MRNLWRSWVSRLLRVFLLSCVGCSAWGQQVQVPGNGRILDSQELIRQGERDRVLREQNERSPDVRLDRPRRSELENMEADERPCFPIYGISLVGEESDAFSWILKDSEIASIFGMCLGVKGIGQVIKLLQNKLLEAGFVTTRVLAPQQDLNSGTLSLVVVPGKIRDVRIQESKEIPLFLNRGLPFSAGDILNLRDIEQTLENLKRAPTAEADIQIVPAEEHDARPGESDLVIIYRQTVPFRLAFSVDDSGARATGKYQGSTTFSFDNPLGLNDLFYFSWNQSISKVDPGNKGTDGQSFHYSLPMNYWLASFNSSKNAYYQAVSGGNQTYIYSGKSENQELKLSRVVFRNASRKVGVWGAIWTKESFNFIDDTEVLVQRRRMAGWSTGFSHKEYLGQATIDGNLGFRHGTGANNALHAPEEKFGEGSHRPEVLTGDFQLNLPFSGKWRYSGTLKGQWNSSPLIPQDRFSIGGRYTVRGFDGSLTLAAEKGWLSRNDLSVGFLGQELYLGVDHGKVSGPSTGNLTGSALTGAVLGVRGGWKGGSWDFFIGQPIYKPERFAADKTVVGATLGWSL